MVKDQSLWGRAHDVIGDAYVRLPEMDWADRVKWSDATYNNNELCAAVLTANDLGGSLAVYRFLMAYFEPGQDGSDSNASLREA